jgi:hypothetical protein
MNVSIQELSDFLDEVKRNENELLEEYKDSRLVMIGDLTKAKQLSYDVADHALGAVDAFVGSLEINRLGLPKEFYERYVQMRNKLKEDLYNTISEAHFKIGRGFDDEV